MDGRRGEVCQCPSRPPLPLIVALLALLLSPSPSTPPHVLSGGFDCCVKVWDTNCQAVVTSFELNKGGSGGGSGGGASARRVHTASMSAAAASHCLVAVGSSGPEASACARRDGRGVGLLGAVSWVEDALPQSASPPAGQAGFPGVC